MAAGEDFASEVDAGSRATSAALRRAWQPLLGPCVAHTHEFLHLCAWCKKVKVGGEWLEVEDAVTRLALFDQPVLPQLSHGVCPACDAEMQRVLAE